MAAQLVASRVVLSSTGLVSYSSKYSTSPKSATKNNNDTRLQTNIIPHNIPTNSLFFMIAEKMLVMKSHKNNEKDLFCNVLVCQMEAPHSLKHQHTSTR
jgi:hypothetical protein